MVSFLRACAAGVLLTMKALWLLVLVVRGGSLRGKCRGFIQGFKDRSLGGCDVGAVILEGGFAYQAYSFSDPVKDTSYKQPQYSGKRSYV
jgi:hypothetical protein